LLSFGRHRPDSESARQFGFQDLPAKLFQRLRCLQHLELFNCGVTSSPADVSLLTGVSAIAPGFMHGAVLQIGRSISYLVPTMVCRAVNAQSAICDNFKRAAAAAASRDQRLHRSDVFAAQLC
jgi:hypothetical protein